ncbi:MAG: hypothetical protein RL272_794 [Candidatus Parcubacteria bacterium]
MLIAEDENFIAKALMHKLVAAGIEVRIAKNGLEGLKMLQDDGIDLALVDILMPRMDGLNMLREFQKGKKRKVPVLVLTNVPRIGATPAELNQLGVIGTIIKAEMPLSKVAERVISILAAE